MRIAVAGATGNIGRLTVTALEREGHEVARVSRSLGADVFTGAGLDAALAGAEAVVDATNCTATEQAEAVAWFGTATRNLLDAGERAGVRHHVLLSIAGMDRVEGNAHYAGKREQERLVAGGPVPWTILPATQFHDFAEMVSGWTEHDGVAAVPPLLVQPVAPADVADVLAELAVGPPRGRYAELAGPEPHDLVELARRTHAARGRTVRVEPRWAVFGPQTPRDALLPAKTARIAPTTFTTWLSQQR
ncbi:NAD(P)H-binding protein [Streptomyces sp. TRM70308]|uniref:SDR family oxidoreductase n=1 Tax=Streptomyces sp. TRM70308 TaxID=3131932 RepID=UPI003D0220FD